MQAKPGAPGQAPSPTERKLKALGLSCPQDFIVHLPLRYEDETRVVPIASLVPGQTAQVQGHVLHSEVQFRPRRQLHATIADESGRLNLRWINFYPSQQKQLVAGHLLRVRGDVRGGFSGLEIVHPKVSRADSPLPQALTPVYPTTQGVSQSVLRRRIDEALGQADLTDTLPSAIRERYTLIPFDQAIRFLHHPDPDVSYAELVEHEHPAWARIKFDELLAQQLALSEARARRRAQKAPVLAETAGGLADRLRDTLPFALTAAQERAVAEIGADLARGFPMLRLLQGDVGSGKTVVAALAAAQAMARGAQVAIMAPTEILAEQHFHKLNAWFEPLGVQVAWLTGNLKARARKTVQQGIASGGVQIVVGTQALIQDKIAFANLGLAILDEQHRFGVGQRLRLSQKGEQSSSSAVPHQLHMSATPIPRSLAMTFFADLDVSVIDELPPGRRPVVTKLVSDARRAEVLEHVSAQVRQGRQAYWVCPLVEESEALQLQTAVDTHKSLMDALPDLRIGLVHGRLSAADKADVMQRFQCGAIDVLVATTVVEVGVDVANAALMVIEHAERFGLAQLHQLRGRVGRGAAQSVCVLMYQAPLSGIARDRLRAMYETSDGFEIARRDLEQRGPGEFLGIRQSGVDLFRFANIDTDGRLVELARDAAALLGREFPEQAQAHLRRWARGRQDLLRS
jgi:ATP-dependent DNA helicase RecG